MVAARFSRVLVAASLVIAATGVYAALPALGGLGPSAGTVAAKTTGNCLPAAATKVEDPGNEETLTAPAGQVIVRVAIKAGRNCYTTPVDATGTVVLNGCYEVAGLGTGEVTVTRTGTGPNCKAISNIQFLTAPAPTGELTICKEAGFGVAPGTVFTILVNGTPYSVPAGMCVPDVTYPIGTQLTIQEVIPAGLTVGSIVCTPPTVCVSTNFATGRAVITIGSGANTVTYTNQLPTNQLTVCKVAGPGVAIGTIFSYNAAGLSFNVAAGADPSGNCTAAGLVAIGTVTVTEVAAVGIVLTDIDCAPAGCMISENLVARSATVTMTATGATVTFTNQAAQ